MKVKFNLNGLDDFLVEMLKADINKYRFELILSAKNMIKRLEKDGYLMKALKRSPVLNAHRDMMEFKAREIVNDIDNVISFEVELPKKDSTSVGLVIWVNPDYFLNADQMREMLPKRLMHRLKIVTRQSLYNDFKRAIMDDYTKDFTCDILESDGEEIRV